MEGDDEKGMEFEFEGVKAKNKMAELYAEANAVKMLNLRLILADSAKGGECADEARKNSQAALKAMNLQLKILSEGSRRAAGLDPAGVEVIWEAMLNVPKMKALLCRDSIREELVESLREQLRKDEG